MHPLLPLYRGVPHEVTAYVKLRSVGADVERKGREKNRNIADKTKNHKQKPFGIPKGFSACGLWQEMFKNDQVKFFPDSIEIVPLTDCPGDSKKVEPIFTKPEIQALGRLVMTIGDKVRLGKKISKQVF